MRAQVKRCEPQAKQPASEGGKVDTTTATATIRLPDLIVTSEEVGVEPQPWGGADAFAYRVRVSCRDAGEYVTTGYGSQMDYSNGVRDAEGIAWMVLGELLSAANDPDEFFEMVAAGWADKAPKRDAVEAILRLLDYAEKAGPVLEVNANEIYDHE